MNGMSCGSCRQTVENALQVVNGVTSAQVNLNPPEAIIEKADTVTLYQLNAALLKAGNYSIGEGEPPSPQKSKGGSCCG
ncbi:MAG: cation transporter [Lutibacter sp.]|nr:cation transporter [Lutibacter sp.]